MSASRGGRVIHGLWPAALLLSACGGLQAPSSACGGAPCPRASLTPSSTAATASSSTATAHGWTTTAGISQGAITVAVVVPGPITVEDGCVAALTAWLVDSAGTRIEPSPSPGVRCHAISLDVVAQGDRRTFSANLPLPGPGVYTFHGLLRTHLPIGAGSRVSENIPVASITVP